MGVRERECGQERRERENRGDVAAYLLVKEGGMGERQRELGLPFRERLKVVVMR